MGDLALVPPIPDAWHANQRDTQADYMAVVTDAIVNHPRSLQTDIGPSEVGTPCTRKLGHKLAGTPERSLPPNWKATIGTGVHLWLEEAFDRANLVWAAANGNQGVERWLTETRFTVGHHLDGTPLEGSCDLFDRLTRTVVDHKTVGPTQLKKYRASGAGNQYRTQAHLYGAGWVARGEAVEHVAIAFLPRNGDLDEAVWWTEPWDPQVAAQALQRLHGVEAALAMLGPAAALAQLPMQDDYCSSCPFFRPGSTDPETGCPGHMPEAPTHTPALTLRY